MGEALQRQALQPIAECVYCVWLSTCVEDEPQVQRRSGCLYYPPRFLARVPEQDRDSNVYAVVLATDEED